MKTWATFLILWLAAAAHADSGTNPQSTNPDLDSNLGSLFGNESEYPDALPPTLGALEAELSALGLLGSPPGVDFSEGFAGSPSDFSDLGPAIAALNDLGPSLDALGPSLDALGPSLDALGPSLDDLSSELFGAFAAEAPELEQLIGEFFPTLKDQTGRRLLRGV